MWYKLKRNYYYYLKCINVYFKAKRKYKEIANAYNYEKSMERKKFSFNPAFIIWGTIGVFLLLSIILIIINSDKIAVRIKAESTRPRTNNKSTDSNITDTSFLFFNKSVEKKAKDRIEMNNAEIIDSFNTNATMDDDSLSVDRSLLSFKNMHYMIFTNKWDKKFLLLKKNGGVWYVFRTYSIAIGEKLGRKMKAGDKKTPEGTYFITGRKDSKELPGMFGPLAYVLNYPNEEDKQSGRTGSGIWIHGTNPDSMPVQTKGCLEMNNGDLIELAEILKSGIGTPVKIVNINETYNPLDEINFNQVYLLRKKILSSYLQKRDYFITILKTWEDAWESKNIEEYSTYYYPDRFFGQGLTWEAWKRKKERTFKLYEMIEVSLDRVFLADYSDSIAVVKFVQAYKSDKINVVNGKKILFVNNNGIWKIFRENTFPKEEHLL